MRRSMFGAGVLFVAIGLSAIAAGVAAASDATVGMVLFGVMFLAGGALFFWVGNWGVHDTRPLLDAELLRYGRPAVAAVLQIEATDEGAPATMTLRVEPVNESAFKATARLAAARGAHEVGSRVRVRFDPNKRKHLIVLD